MKRTLLIVGLVCLLLLPATAQAMTFDQAMDQLVAQGYPASVVQYLCGLGSNADLGFRMAGTSSDNRAAGYIAGRLRAMGLANVRLEPVPVDVFEFTSARVMVGGRTIVASTFAGVPPTPAGGLTGGLVYVGAGSAADFDAAPSVAGKLVLADVALDYWWLNYVGAEAKLRGARGIMMTRGPMSGGWFAIPDAWGSIDACYDFDLPPIVYIPWADGDWLKAELDTAASAGRTLSAAMVLDEKVRFADKGGVGYNVVGELPGTASDGTFVLYCAHHDAYFSGGFDNASGVAMELALARAMTRSGYRPQHRVVFLFTTAEEFGYTNAWFDWAIGAWWANERAHPGWAGSTRAVFNLDLIGAAGTPLFASSSVDMAPWLRAKSKELSPVLPYGAYVFTPNSYDADAWTFAAAGIPAIQLAAPPNTGDAYHTDYDDSVHYPIDWEYVGQIAKFVQRLQVDLDTQLLPYDLKARGDELAAVVVPGDLLSAGADQASVARLQTAINDFRAAANHFAARRGSIPARDVPAANAVLLRVQKQIGDGFTALNAYDTAYPHEQVLAEARQLSAAISALDQQVPRPNVAAAALRDVQGTFAVDWFDDQVYRRDMSRTVPGYYRLAWGEQAHLAPRLDVVDEYHAVQDGTWGPGTIDRLKAMRDAEIGELNARLDGMSAVLEDVTPRVLGL